MLAPKTFYSVLTPMFYISKIFGLSPFQINTECYRKSKINMTWSITFMLSTYIYSIIFLHGRSVFGKSVLTKVPEFVNSYLSPSSMLVYILFGCLFTNRILNALKSIDTFDKEMKNFLRVNLKREYRKSKIYLILGLLSTIIHLSLSILFTAIIANTAEYFLESLLLYVCPTIINAFVGFQFCALTLLVKQRFFWLNRKIAAIFDDTDNLLKESGEKFPDIVKYGTEYNKKTLSSIASPILETIRIKHHFLCVVCLKINTAYSAQILLMVLKNFVTLITGLFYCGKHLMYVGYIQRDYLIYSVIQLSLAIVQLVALAVVCSSTSSEAQKMGLLVHDTAKIPSQCKSELKLQLSFFSLQLLHQTVDFTACRIFVVNENLLLTIVGAVSTYLVIIIQFQLQDYRKIKQNN